MKIYIYINKNQLKIQVLEILDWSWRLAICASPFLLLPN